MNENPNKTYYRESVRFAPVVPSKLAYMMKRQEEDFHFPVLGDYHLLLAHDVAEDERYTEVYCRDDDFIIMDNSMVELGMPVGPEIMSHALRNVLCDCFVLPDVRYEMQATVEMSKQAAQDWKSCRKMVKSDSTPFMAVPQGKDLAEYVECAKELAKIDGVGYFGIPRSVYNVLGTRVKLVKELQKIPFPFATEQFIHLLGFTNSLLDDIEAAQLEGIMGIDSAVPVRVGQKGQLIHPRMSDPGPRGDFWDREWTHLTTQTMMNVTMMRRWINRGLGA